MVFLRLLWMQNFSKTGPMLHNQTILIQNLATWATMLQIKMQQVYRFHQLLTQTLKILETNSATRIQLRNWIWFIEHLVTNTEKGQLLCFVPFISNDNGYQLIQTCANYTVSWCVLQLRKICSQRLQTQRPTANNAPI